jgi:hypothetical protein
MRRLPAILLVLFASNPAAAAPQADTWLTVDQPLTRAASEVQGEGKDRRPFLAIVVATPGLEPYVVPAAGGA